MHQLLESYDVTNCYSAGKKIWKEGMEMTLRLHSQNLRNLEPGPMHWLCFQTLLTITPVPSHCNGLGR